MSPFDNTPMSEIAELGRDPEWLRGVPSGIAEALHEELGVAPDLRSTTQATAESVVRLFAEMVEREERPEEVNPPSETAEYVREFVMRGVPLDTLVRAYHVGHAAFFERWAAALRARID